MKRLEHLHSKIENEYKGITVTEEAYDLWISNDVTQRLMLEIEHGYMDTVKEDFIGDKEYMYEQQIRRNERLRVLLEILEWNPLKD